MHKIKGIIKEYAWGGYDYLNELLNHSPVNLQPKAEYWLGTHAMGEAVLAHDTSTRLSQIVGDAGLPYLLKLLDVRDMLSIQVHPSRNQASSGFAREEKGHLPIDHPTRVYRDSNHKPELMVALSDFYLVQGFLAQDKLAARFLNIPEFKSLQKILSSGGSEELFRYWMNCPQKDVNEVLKPLGKRIKPLYEAGKLDRTDIEFWAARAFLTFNRPGRCDRGILVLYMMNLIYLREGEGVFQKPGTLHAYLQGQTVECMATSDNVVRGGLTQKHMDVSELLKVTTCTATIPQIIFGEPRESGIVEYPVPEEFSAVALTKILGVKSRMAIKKDSIFLCLQGSLTISMDADSNMLDLIKGEAAYLNRAGSIKIRTSTDCLAFMASA